MNNILKVVVFVSAIAMATMPAFADISGEVGYSATVAVGQSTSVLTSNGAFGQILVGDNKTISQSINLVNEGDIGATVEARFTSSYLGIYGMNTGTSVIGAHNFSLKNNTDSIWYNLNNDGSDVFITTVTAYSSRSLDAKLLVPPGTAAGAYRGTVLMTFGNVP